MIFFLLFIILSSSTVSSAYNNNLNGSWHWTRTNIKELDEMLQMMGVKFLKRKAICNLDLVEKYTIFNRHVEITKITKIKTIEDRFSLMRREEIKDEILGDVTQKMTYTPHGSLLTHIRRPDGSVYDSKRELMRNNANIMIYNATFTSHGQSLSCTMQFTRLLSSL